MQCRRCSSEVVGFRPEKLGQDREFRSEDLQKENNQRENRERQHNQLIIKVGKLKLSKLRQSKPCNLANRSWLCCCKDSKK